jgi:WD40 repeat protein
MIISSDTNGLLKIWNMKKQVCLGSFDKHEGKVWALDVSPSTQGNLYIVTGGNDSLLHIWKDITEVHFHHLLIGSTHLVVIVEPLEAVKDPKIQ